MLGAWNMNQQKYGVELNNINEKKNVAVYHDLYELYINIYNAVF
jgi:hypothetical protein